jgi:RecA-family ATPase
MIDDPTIVPLDAYERKAKASSLPVISAADFAGREPPERHFHVAGLIPGRTVSLLSGDGGTGKSMLALQLAVATAAGTNWCALSVSPGPVVYLSAEDDEAELHRRLVAIAEHEGIDLADLQRLRIIPLAGRDAVLAAPGKTAVEATRLFKDVEAVIAAHVPALVVIDTLADVFGGQENDRAQARQFVGMLRGWAIRYSAAVLVLSHPSLSGMASGSGTSGSTAWNNSVRSRIYLERVKVEDLEPDPDARVLKTLKSNYGPTGGEIRLRWQAGVFHTTDNAETASAFGAIAARAKAEQVFLSLVQAFSAEGRRVSPQPSANYAPLQFSRDHRAEGVSKRALMDAMGRLFADGRIRVAEEGPPSKRRTTITMAG